MISALSCVVLVVASAAGHVLPPNPEPPVDYYANHLKIQKASPKCMDDLGCFPITNDFFHLLYRPINLTPADRQKINTKFLMYSKANAKQSYQMKAKDEKLFKASGFDVKKKTKIIIHGYIDNQLFAEWMREIKDEFLLNGDHNVILVDWSGGNGLPYTQAAANTRVVGAEIAFFLDWLKDNHGLKLSDVHILGHSLGSHVAGYAGERLTNLGRITALDPAEPYYQNLPASVRIDPTDADFVDVIHTDSVSFFTRLGLGMSQLVGHVDFFPNDGQSHPGCGKIESLIKIVTEGVVEGVRRTVACNHMRAIDFAQDSINSHKCVPTAYACADWKTFLDGKCAECGPKGDKCAVMGEKAPEHYFKFKNGVSEQKFFVKTSDKAPYCLYHYQVTLTLSNNKQLKDQSGSLKLTLKGDNNKEIKMEINEGKSTNLNPGATYTFLATTSEEIKDVNSVTFGWDGGRNWIVIGAIWGKKVIAVDSLRILPMNGVDEKLRTSQIRKFCGSKHEPIISRDETTFSKSDLC